MHKHLVLSVSPLPNRRLFVVFTDSSKRVYDVNGVMDELPVFKVFLVDNDLFNKVAPVAKGAGIVWNDDLDLSSDELYVNGEEVLS